ncbi:(2Fe-2S)-binding protein [Mycolicibacterium moriokaense]|uniref:(2Fe-2S)-binding protein n=1 Tax=Mycolicibacterium moriokaense TaxID=39691 RepID=UPI000D761193|nr:(2Fe-2S)-binding protein [Mycolicibacterium moriokaense]
MYVCLCAGACSEMVKAAIAHGATTTQQVASVCGAGSDCGRCRPTVRAMINTGTRRHAAASCEALCCRTPA